MTIGWWMAGRVWSFLTAEEEEGFSKGLTIRSLKAGNF